MTRENSSASHFGLPDEPRRSFRIVSEGGVRASFPARSDSPPHTSRPDQLLRPEWRR